MYAHKNCGGPVKTQSVVYEYAPVLVIEEGYYESGDVETSVIEEVKLYCDTCEKVIEDTEVEKEEE